jgi:hypothetical protein
LGVGRSDVGPAPVWVAGLAEAARVEDGPRDVPGRPDPDGTAPVSPPARMAPGSETTLPVGGGFGAVWDVMYRRDAGSGCCWPCWAAASSSGVRRGGPYVAPDAEAPMAVPARVLLVAEVGGTGPDLLMAAPAPLFGSGTRWAAADRGRGVALLARIEFITTTDSPDCST